MSTKRRDSDEADRHRTGVRVETFEATQRFDDRRGFSQRALVESHDASAALELIDGQSRKGTARAGGR